MQTKPAGHEFDRRCRAQWQVNDVLDAGLNTQHFPTGHSNDRVTGFINRPIGSTANVAAGGAEFDGFADHLPLGALAAAILTARSATYWAASVFLVPRLEEPATRFAIPV